MSRAFYTSTVENFLTQTDDAIFGALDRHNTFDLSKLQRNAWAEQISILKRELVGLKDAWLAFEYTIPRMGKRIDNVLIYRNCVFILEFKAGTPTYDSDAVEQVTDYAHELQNFHKASQNSYLIPILVATEAPALPIPEGEHEERIHAVIKCNGTSIRSVIDQISESVQDKVSPIDAQVWFDSPYSPTPTIVEAAQMLYQKHEVEAITYNSAGATNLTTTSDAVYQIIDDCQRNKKKAICFITGVPGAGKTLAGLNIANKCHSFSDDKHAVLLSGNGPLVDVLREALARDEKERLHIKKKEADSHVKAFIQPIHHFRDDAIVDTRAPKEKIAIFDEAQRAWNADKLSHFMKQKKGRLNFTQSEPEFLISVMDRHEDWAVIVCLVGGGQEINTGEAGILEWFQALRKSFRHWQVYLSDRMTDTEYAPNGAIIKQVQDLDYHIIRELHLAVTLRSLRSELVADFVKLLLDGNIEKAKSLHHQFKEKFPIYLTRNLHDAQTWIKQRALDSDSNSYGLVASSKAMRLRPYGIWVKNSLDAPKWFLNPPSDIRSACAMEEVATEYDIQGLELDWVLVGWDADFRRENGKWACYSFKGTSWNNTNAERAAYLKNAYRVLLTRARQGMVIFVPPGDPNDAATRNPEWYDGIYETLSKILH